jgi:hypothetical protein
VELAVCENKLAAVKFGGPEARSEVFEKQEKKRASYPYRCDFPTQQDIIYFTGFGAVVHPPFFRYPLNFGATFQFRASK